MKPKDISTSEAFCHQLLNLDIKYAKSFTNLVMALASNTTAQSVVQLSESPLYHHQYSSIRDGIHGIGTDCSEQQEAMSQIRSLISSHLPSSSDWLVFQTDASAVQKAYSSCLAKRQYIKINNNVISNNKPISIGYPISLINLSIAPSSCKWSVPLDIQRIDSSESATQCAVRQISTLLEQTELKLSKRNIINTLDSGYGSPDYLCPIHKHDNLVNVVRFRYGKKIWEQATKSSTEQTNTGAPLIYGTKYYLTDISKSKTYRRKESTYQVYQTSIFDKPHDDYIELSGKTTKGRVLKILIWRWNDLLIRTKKGQNMKNKSFDLIASKVIDETTGELVFQKTMFVTIHGKQKAKITTEQAFESYRHRYDIEPAIKFTKQKLLLEKYQTPDVQHFDNWLVVIMTSFWLLFMVSKEGTYIPKKWQQYKPVNKKHQAEQGKTLRLTPSQSKQAAEKLFLTFDSAPFRPQNSKKGLGRKKGITLSQRTKHDVVKKTTNKANLKLKTEKKE